MKLLRWLEAHQENWAVFAGTVVVTFFLFVAGGYMVAEVIPHVIWAIFY